MPPHLSQPKDLNTENFHHDDINIFQPFKSSRCRVVQFATTPPRIYEADGVISDEEYWYSQEELEYLGKKIKYNSDYLCSSCYCRRQGQGRIVLTEQQGCTPRSCCNEERKKNRQRTAQNRRTSLVAVFQEQNFQREECFYAPEMLSKIYAACCESSRDDAYRIALEVESEARQGK